jgi:ATP-dependent Clp protease ATP-binding subunit ClpA
VFKHNYIGTEHLLLGLLREEEGVAARALEELDVTLEDVRSQLARIVGWGDEAAVGQIPFTPRGKKVLELGLREALSLGHNYIGTEHILLGLVREGEGVAMAILRELGANGEKIRNQIVRTLSGPASPFAVPLEWESLDLDPEARALLEKVKAEKETALEAKDLGRAASLRARERRLARLAQKGDVEAVKAAAEEPLLMWESGPRPTPVPPLGGSGPGSVTSLRAVATARDRWAGTVLLVGWLMFGISLGIGILIGWLIWG